MQRCGVVGERSGKPCVRGVGHPGGSGGGHRSIIRSGPKKVKVDHIRTQALHIPDGLLPTKAAEAMARYANWLAKPGETLHEELAAKL
jgi:hypothetical protein